MRLTWSYHSIAAARLVEHNLEGGCLLPAPFEEKLKYFLELPFRAGLGTVSGRAVERGAKDWRTADAVHLCSHCPVWLDEADPQSLPMSFFVCAMPRNRRYWERNGRISGACVAAGVVLGGACR